MIHICPRLISPVCNGKCPRQYLSLTKCYMYVNKHWIMTDLDQVWSPIPANPFVYISATFSLIRFDGKINRGSDKFSCSHSWKYSWTWRRWGFRHFVLQSQFPFAVRWLFPIKSIKLLATPSRCSAVYNFDRLLEQAQPLARCMKIRFTST